MLTLPGIGKAIEEDVARSGLVDRCDASEELFIERAVSCVEACAPQPLDEKSPLARRLLEDLARHDRRVLEAEARAERCRTRRDELQAALLRAVPCWTRTRLLGTAAAYVLLALAAGAVVGAVLAPTLDSGFFANYLPDKFDGDAGLLVMSAAFLASGGLVFLIALLQLAVALATSGAMGGARVAQLIALDVLFAAAWGLQRLGAGGGFMAGSVTLLELITMAAYSLAIGALCGALRANAERAAAYRPAASAAKAASVAYDRAEAARTAAERDRLPLLKAVAERDLAARSSAMRRLLVAETARSAYRVATAAAIEKAVANPTLDRLHADLDRQLASRSAAVAQPPTSKGLA